MTLEQNGEILQRGKIITVKIEYRMKMREKRDNETIDLRWEKNKTEGPLG